MEINFNPYWTVPVSIVRRDLIPKMQAEPDYLTKNHIRIFDRSNRELQPEQINWETEEAVNYQFKQDPGDFNSLGAIRINFPNAHDVYMHDTPLKNLFGEDFRFHSSGCVRIQNVRELVYWLLSETPGWPRVEVDRVIKSAERKDARLAKPVPLHWVYVTAWATADGVVQFRDDIYGRDGLGPVADTRKRGRACGRRCVRGQLRRLPCARVASAGDGRAHEHQGGAGCGYRRDWSVAGRRRVRRCRSRRGGGPTDVVAAHPGRSSVGALERPVGGDREPARRRHDRGDSAVAKAPADGYTLLVATNSLLINPAIGQKLPYDTRKGLRRASAWWRRSRSRWSPTSRSRPTRIAGAESRLRRRSAEPLNFTSPGAARRRPPRRRDAQAARRHQDDRTSTTTAARRR